MLVFPTLSVQVAEWRSKPRRGSSIRVWHWLESSLGCLAVVAAQVGPTCPNERRDITVGYWGQTNLDLGSWSGVDSTAQEVSYFLLLRLGKGMSNFDHESEKCNALPKYLGNVKCSNTLLAGGNIFHLVI